MRRRGFTLIELMVVIAVLGVLAAIAIPSFMGYVHRSKSSEAPRNLKNLFQHAATYYVQEIYFDRVVSATGAASVTVEQCTVGPAVSSNSPTATKTVVDWNTESSSFTRLGFGVADPVYYQYEIADSADMCGHPPSTPLYSFRAVGDLTGDGTTSLFELAVGSSSQNILMRAPGLFNHLPGE